MVRAENEGVTDEKVEQKKFLFDHRRTILCLSTMIFYNHFSYYNSIMGKMQNQGMGIIREVKESVEKYFTKAVDVVQLTSFALEYMIEDAASQEEIKSFLTYESGQYEEKIDAGFSGIYGVIDDTFHHGSGWIADESYNPKERVWYLKAKENPGKVVLVSPYKDIRTGTAKMSVSKLLADGESAIGVDITLDEIQNLIEGISANTSGYGFIVDKNGRVIAHSNTDEIGKDYFEEAEMAPVLNTVFGREQSYFEARLGGKENQICAVKIMEDWYGVEILDKELFFGDVNRTLVRNVLLYSIISCLIVFIYLYALRRVQRSIKLERDVKERIRSTNIKLIHALVRTIDAKDRYTNGHSVRVAEYAYKIAQKMGKSEEEQQTIYFAGLLHDVGKIRVLDEIINKQDRLTEEEYNQIKLHPVTGYHILKDIYDDKTIALGVKFHHERYDGKGYPVGLGGKNIPEIARILAVADTYDAMTSNRSYRKALNQEKVRSEIEKGKGTQFDPEIAEVMLQMIEEDSNFYMREMVSAQKTVLVIDAESENIKQVEQYMQDESICNIVSASDSTEALRVLEEGTVHLILLTVEATEMKDFETFVQIREKYDIPTIIVAGNKGIDAIQSSKEISAEECISRPFTPHMLKEIIHSMLKE